jgi:hypothetical protein
MDRRKALKNMGMALGYTVATPTLLSIVQSCKTEKTVEWTPDFFTKEEGAALNKLVDIILPKTDTPSASEMQVDVFIDRFAKQAMEQQQQDFLKMSMGKFLENALKESGKENVGKLETADLEKVLASALKISKEQMKTNDKAIAAYMEGIATGSGTALGDDLARYAFASNLRGMTIWGYKTSEFVGEEVMAYLPIPGEYVPCGDLQELTGGKAWSI